MEIPNLFFVSENKSYIPLSLEMFTRISQLEYVNTIVYSSNRVKNEIDKIVIDSISNNHFYDYELWNGILLEEYIKNGSTNIKLGIDSNKNIIAIDNIKKGSFICKISGEIEYRPLFCLNRDSHFMYNVGLCYKRYIINMSKRSNISALIPNSKHNNNLDAMSVLSNKQKEIILIANQEIKAGDKLSCCFE